MVCRVTLRPVEWMWRCAHRSARDKRARARRDVHTKISIRRAVLVNVPLARARRRARARERGSRNVEERSSRSVAPVVHRLEPLAQPARSDARAFIRRPRAHAREDRARDAQQRAALADRWRATPWVLEGRGHVRVRAANAPRGEGEHDEHDRAGAKHVPPKRFVGPFAAHAFTSVAESGSGDYESLRFAPDLRCKST